MRHHAFQPATGGGHGRTAGDGRVGLTRRNYVRAKSDFIPTGFPACRADFRGLVLIVSGWHSESLPGYLGLYGAWPTPDYHPRPIWFSITLTTTCVPISLATLNAQEPADFSRSKTVFWSPFLAATSAAARSPTDADCSGEVARFRASVRSLANSFAISPSGG